MSREPHQVRPSLEVLEDRSVPAANVFLQDGTLFIVGANGADTVLLSQTANELIISQPGLTDQAIRLGLFQNIVVSGFRRQDAFANLTSFPISGFVPVPGTLISQQNIAFNPFLGRFSPLQGGFVGLLEASLQASIFPLSQLTPTLPPVTNAAPVGAPQVAGNGATTLLTPTTLASVLTGNVPLALAINPGLGPGTLQYNVDANGYVVQRLG